jgi:hypothetical protein
MEKPLEEFYKNSGCKDGRLGRCIKCVRAYSDRHPKDHCEIAEHYFGLGMLICSECHLRKPFKDFSKNKTRKTGRTTICKRCANIKHKQSYEENRESRLEYVRTHREEAKNNGIKRKYGKDIKWFETQMLRQDGKCAICSKSITGAISKRGDSRRDTACVDHCHESNQVRGLLCGPCNIGLGCFLDDPVLLTSAINYLKKYSIL